jgi:hypothetical protein
MKWIWKRLTGGLWHAAGPKAEWVGMWRPGPWPITARAACSSRHEGQHNDNGHNCHGGAACSGTVALTSVRRRGAGKRKENGWGWGASPKMGHGRGAVTDRHLGTEDASLAWTERSRAPWSSRQRLTVAAPHGRRALTPELGRWCRAAPGAAIGCFRTEEKRKNKGARAASRWPVGE